MATVKYRSAKEAVGVSIDDSQSKVLDIGDTRIIWGSNNIGQNHVVGMGSSFANTSYRLIITPRPTATMNPDMQATVNFRTKGTTFFTADYRLDDDGSISASSTPCDWIAIGAKP